METLADPPTTSNRDSQTATVDSPAPTEKAVEAFLDPVAFLKMAAGFIGLPDAPKFQARNQTLADAAQDILLDENPMTLRQLYYRLVSAGVLRNEHVEYRRIGRVMTVLRECGHIPRTWIVDHLRQTLKLSSWSGLADYGESVRDCYRKNFWASLPDYVCVFCEKDATAGTIQQVTEKYDVPLHVCRGYSSISFASEIAQEWRLIEKPIYALYCGDFDPSGFDIERDLRAKLKRYTADSDCHFAWERLAVREEDFDDFDLIHLPVKKTDVRSKGFIKTYGEACAELDALPPSELRTRVEKAILDFIDDDEWRKLQHIEELERESVAKVMGKFDLDQVSGDGKAKQSRKRG